MKDAGTSAPRPEPPRKSRGRRLVTAAATLAVLAIIFLSIDRAAFARAFADLHAGWFALSLLLFVPQSLLAAFRWVLVARVSARLPLVEALRMLMAGNTLNLVLPTKMGDLVRGWWLHRVGGISLSRGVNVVVFEKLADLGALALMVPLGVAVTGAGDAVATSGLLVAGAVVTGVVLVYTTPIHRLVPGWIGGPFARPLARIRTLLVDTREMARSLVRARGRFAAILALTVLLWLLHVAQFIAFFRAVRSDVAPAVVFARVPLAILVGLVPVTIAGLGTRDATLILLMKPFVDPGRTAAVAVLSFLRYLVPGLAGLPWLSRYILGAREAAGARGGPPGPGAA